MHRIALFNPNRGTDVIDGDLEWLLKEVQNPKTYDNKNNLPAYKPGELTTRTRKGSDFVNYSAVVIDVDAYKGTFGDFKTELEALGLYSVAYTTASHCPGETRVRVIFPTSKPITHKARIELAGMVNRALGGVLGFDSFDNRIMYYGKVAATSDHFQSVELHGNNIDSSYEFCHNEPLYPAGFSQQSIKKADGFDYYELLAKDRIPDNEIDNVRAALGVLKQNGHNEDNNQWRSVGIILKNSGELGWQLFDEFSKDASNYDEIENRELWEAIKPANSSYVALYRRAMALGWVNPGTKKENKQKKTTELRLMTGSQIWDEGGEDEWLVKDIIAPGKGLLFGNSGCGKSFVMLDICWHLAQGKDWHYGKRTPSKKDIIYIAGEGHRGIGNRLKALSIHYNTPDLDNLLVSSRSIPLNDLDCVNELVSLLESAKQEGFNPGLMVVDTLHSNFLGDENSSQEIGQLFEMINNQFIAKFGCEVMLVHHTGASSDNRLRGSTAIRASMDKQLKCEMDSEKVITLGNDKDKDHEDFQPLRFKLKSIDLGVVDSLGDPRTSAILIPYDSVEFEQIEPDGRILKVMEAIESATNYGEVIQELEDRAIAMVKANNLFLANDVLQIKAVQTSIIYGIVDSVLTGEGLKANSINTTKRRLVDNLKKDRLILFSEDGKHVVPTRLSWLAKQEVLF